MSYWRGSDWSALWKLDLNLNPTGACSLVSSVLLVPSGTVNWLRLCCSYDMIIIIL